MGKQRIKVISIGEKIKRYQDLFLKLSIFSVSFFVGSSIGLLINGHLRKKKYNKLIGVEPKSKKKSK